MSLTVSPTGEFFATGGRTGEVLWYEAATGEVLERWQLASMPIVGLAFDQSGPSTGLGIVTLDHRKVWLTRGHPPVDGLPPGSTLEAILDSAQADWINHPPTTSMVESTHGDYWAQGTPDGQITVGLVSTKSRLASWHGHEAAVTGLAWGPDGAYLLSCGYDGSLIRWDPRTGQPLGHL